MRVGEPRLPPLEAVKWGRTRGLSKSPAWKRNVRLPRTAGARPHCDFDFGFNLQLKGTKTWRLAPNTNFSNPHKSVIIEDPFDPEVAAYATGALPRAMPTEGAREAIAKPGSVVFLPRGYWHTTVAHEPSLALTFACKGATWSELVAREIERRLRMFEGWREFPERWVGPAGTTRSAKQVRLAELLQPCSCRWP